MRIAANKKLGRLHIHASHFSYTGIDSQNQRERQGKGKRSPKCKAEEGIDKVLITPEKWCRG